MTVMQSGKLMIGALEGLIAAAYCSMVALTANAQDYCVATNGNDSWAGTGWDVPFLTIQKGIDSATAGQTVAVSNGTYVLTTQLLLNKGITLQGFGGASNTVIDANLTGRILSISDSAAVMDGFTLKNGKSASSMNGVGVSMTGGTLQNCTVSSCTNTAQVNGGGLYVAGASCLVTNCVISGNFIGAPRGTESGGASRGGGIYISAGRVLSCVVSNNTASAYRDTSGQYGGGGLYVVGNVMVSNCTVSGNAVVCTDAQTRGGGIYVDGGTVADCVVDKNSVGAWGGDRYSAGGGLYITNAALVERCVITRNYQVTYFNALQYGAGVYNNGGTMRNCQIVGNTSSSLGGGVYLAAGRVLDCAVSNNTVAANRTWNMGGGGFYVTGSGMASNCTVSGNAVTCVDAITRGGGIFAAGGTVVACVVSNNSAAGYGSQYAAGGGLYTTNAARVERCVITRNYLVDMWVNNTLRYGGGAYSDGGIMRSCLIMGNTANTLGGGLYMTGGTNENCTIVRNACSGGNYGGVYWTNSPVIINAIVYNNVGGVANNIQPIVGGVSGVTYSCSQGLTSGTGNVTADPLFVDSGSGSGISFTAGDYRPVIGSPCEKIGLVADWMSTALELSGLSRLNGSQVDMGCYLVAVPPKSTYVAESGDDGNAGTSWEAPFKTIQKGIDAATALGTVSVSNGTYVLTSQLLLGKACTLLGMGGREQTIINANATGRILTIDNANAVVEGFTLKNGKSATAINGTGVSMAGGVLRNCTVSSCTNTATSGTVQGVGIYMTGGTLDTCTVEKNRAVSTSGPINGGGICLDGSSCIATNCLIANNYIGQEWATASKGGGAYLSAGKLLGSVVKNNTVNQGRYSNGGGGGVFVTGAGVASNCTVSANAVICVDTITRGGGVYVNWGSVADCVVSNNSSQGYSAGNGTFGGGVYMTGPSLVERCVITKNYQNIGWTSSRYGAGVASDGGVMRNCLIMGNTANSLGGGLYITGGTNENCTLVRNQCLSDHAGVGQYGGVYWTNTPVIVNAIVYNNTSSSGESNILAVVGGVANVTYSCAPSLTSGTGNKTADPQFTVSGAGYGTTFTAGDYRLTAPSPCKNTGSTELRMKTATDLDGLPRVKAFIVDMGAYERQVGNVGTMIRVF